MDEVRVPREPQQPAAQPDESPKKFKYRSWYWYDDREGYWDYTDDPASRPGQKWEANPDYEQPAAQPAETNLQGWQRVIREELTPTAQPQCAMRHAPVWKAGANGLPYQESNFQCEVCGYLGKHDAHPGCKRPERASAEPVAWLVRNRPLSPPVLELDAARAKEAEADGYHVTPLCACSAKDKDNG
jgi:hypothetical protein